ncbi:MAG: hypothetical protein AOY29_08845 [Alcanivorax borkumensis]|uniref:ParB/Sulfiredoxin domain-containing protein n=1 Tax=Alcanivorax borkumensis (strain ATCC 700651 / DSM 11573 / NCIMB 13689 / SK2) TaxID=393595 RepID=Q0VNZ3_ALCBS|nr:hypothetical protein [Alcanivorax borkumensis]OJH08794.1 MAG: hypothetical protein AOY29_08845 [Alcanivorax borkumensis]CAL17105.1 hypothetical protein ABO_1657 [Alcanivorax borkumensis SK2]
MTADAKREHIPLELLLLDEKNPRFGNHGQKLVSQTEVLDHIVSTFSVEDVLSSIAVNGFFEAEPLVCVGPNKKGEFTVAEGNRRLSACLILAGDERAKNWKRKTEEYQKIHEKHGSKAFDPVPVTVFSANNSDKTLLSYLGVRHIASSQQWDSYAKAVWIANVIQEGEIDVKTVAEMIGDKHQTVSRLLEGYYFIRQLEDENQFIPSNSQRKGRGSNTTYPFSWVYTLLGYASVRDFLGLNDSKPRENPVEREKINNASLLVSAMFGDRSKGKDSALNDSRQLSTLAKVVSDPEKISLLRNGKKIDEIIKATQPIDERLGDGLLEAQSSLRDISSRLMEEDISSEIAEKHKPAASKVSKLASSVFNKLQEISDE